MAAADDRLFAAIAAGDLTAARAALAAGADAAAVREFDAAGEREPLRGSESALMAAVAVGELPLVELLLARGVPLDERDASSGRTALWMAAAAGALPIVRALLAVGADPLLPDGRSGDDPFATAVAHGHLEVARALREAGAPSSERALRHACCRGSRELVVVCLHGRVTLATAPVLTEAATSDRAELLEWLSTQGADLAREAGPALVGASHSGSLAAARWLLAHGAPVGWRNEYQWPPLHFAAWGGHMAVVDALLAAGADPLAACGGGRTARSWAEEAGHEPIVARLLAAEQGHGG